ncbi:MAG TPA: hypothetical protein VGR74_12855 [Actinomycetota bacterium]|nr:hypothetical protein [Actinomycetota bacterium]
MPLYGAIAAAELLIKLRWQDPPDGPVYYRSTVTLFAWDDAPPIGPALLQDLKHAAPTLAVLAGLALAVFALPRVRPAAARHAVVGGVVAVALAWWLISEQRSWFYGFWSATARALPQLLVALAAVGLAWVGWRRGPAGRLAAAGAVLMVLPGMVADGPPSLTGFWPTDAFTGDSEIAVAMAVAPPSGGADTVVPLLYLAGLALIATACVRHALPEGGAQPG